MGATELPEAGASRELLPALGVLPGHLLWRAHARVTVALGEVLPPGVDLHAYAVLLALSGGVTRSQQALADAVSVSRTTMGSVATELAERGLVERVRNPADRRSYALTRTPAGAAAARSWRRHADEVERSVTAGFEEHERAALHDLLLRAAESELSPDVPDALRSSVAFLVTRVHMRLHRDFVTVLEPVRIEPRHFGVLSALTSLGPVPQATLARALGVSGPSVVQMIDDLEARGLVQRRRSATDRRTQLLHLTAAAPGILSEVADLASDAIDRCLHPLTPADIERLTDLLRRFVTAP